MNTQKRVTSLVRVGRPHGLLTQAQNHIDQWSIVLMAPSSTRRRFSYWVAPVGSLIILLTMVTGVLAQPTVYQNSGAIVPFTAKTDAQQMPTPITLGLEGAFQEGRNIHKLKAVSANEIARADRVAAAKFAQVRPGPLRMGMVRAVGAAPLSVQDSLAKRVTLPDGRRVWTLALNSPGAFGIRVHFTSFDIGAGSAIVYAHGTSGVIARGPYTGKGPNQTGDFWTASLPGETVFIEVSGSNKPRLEVAKIMHFDTDLWRTGQRQQDALAPEELDCHIDAMCRSVDPLARDATVALGLIDDDPGIGYFCSGTILNDLDGDTIVPYLLTAKHCDFTSANVNSIEVVYLYQRSICGGILPDPMTLPMTIGGTVLASNGENDMMFIRLNGELPGGVTMAGWSTATSTGNYSIHHPQGTWKRVTFMEDVGFCPSCVTHDPTDYDYYDQTDGIVEGGSSGAGIFDTAGRLVGQLEGTRCVGSGCDPEDCSTRSNFWAIFGEFEETYPLIKRWLEIGGTIHVDRNYTGTELGTPTQPFRTVTAAYNFAWNGARIKIKAGSYRETLAFSKQVKLLTAGGTVTIGQ